MVDFLVCCIGKGMCASIVVDVLQCRLLIVDDELADDVFVQAFQQGLRPSVFLLAKHRWCSEKMSGSAFRSQLHLAVPRL